MVSFGHTMGKVFVQNPVPHFVHTGALELPQVAAADLLGGHGATVAGAPSHSHSATLAPTTMYGGFIDKLPPSPARRRTRGGLKRNGQACAAVGTISMRLNRFAAINGIDKPN